MALGAERGAVLSLILASGAKPVLTGMLTGLAGSIVLALKTALALAVFCVLGRGIMAETYADPTLP